ncbi:MAG: hypothetical protein ACR2G2_11445 [Pseudonocardia sp.]
MPTGYPGHLPTDDQAAAQPQGVVQLVNRASAAIMAGEHDRGGRHRAAVGLSLD